MPASPILPRVAAPADAKRPPVPSWIGVVCALLVVIPYYGIAILSGIAVQENGIGELPTLLQTLQQAFLITGVFCGLTWVLLRYVCQEDVASLSRPGGSLLVDFLHAVNISALLLVAQIAIGMSMGMEKHATPEFNLLLGKQLQSSPLALLVWAGPVAWLQAGLTEEFTRAFVLTRLWKQWQSPAAQFTSLVLMSALFGMGHFYQGWPGVIGTFAIGMVFGFHYMRFRSLRAIVLGHGIYDTTVMLLLWLGSSLAM